MIERLQREIAKSRRRIVFIGDAMTDRWVHGNLSECQEGCRKFVQTYVCCVPGGAGNAKECLQHWNVNTDLYGQNKLCRQPTKTRFVVDNRVVFRHDNELPLTTSERIMCRWMYDAALEAVGRAHGVLLSDYDKGVLTQGFVRQVVALCERRGIPCVADCKREPGMYAGCLLKCNSDYQHQYNDELHNLAERGVRFVVTAGRLNPIMWIDGGPVGLGYDLKDVPCINHVGAGDCFAAHLTLALAYAFHLREAVAFAHSAGRVYVQHPHNRAPKPSEVAVDLQNF